MAAPSDNNYIPRDYNDLYHYYIVGDGRGNSLTHQMIRKLLRFATEDERETLAHDVFVRLMEHDMLKRFDPTKANFGGVIFFTVRTVVANHLNRKGRNPLTGLHGGSLVDQTVNATDEGEFERGVYHLDHIFPAEQPDPDRAIDARDLVALLLKATKKLYDAPRHKRDESLYPLIPLLQAGYDPHECGKRLGVTASTVHNWTTVLREMTEAIKATWLSPRKRPQPAGRAMPTEE